MTTEKEIDDAIQAYLTEQCYGEDAQPDGLMIAAEAGWRLLRTERDAALALAERRQATIDLAAQVQDLHVGQIHDLRALAERRAGEIAQLYEERGKMLRQFRFIRQDAASDLRRQTPITTFDGIVELCDAALAAAPPPSGAGNGMAAVAGAWPGNETEEQLLATLDFLDGKGPPPAGEDAGGTD